MPAAVCAAGVLPSKCDTLSADGANSMRGRESERTAGVSGEVEDGSDGLARLRALMGRAEDFFLHFRRRRWLRPRAGETVVHEGVRARRCFGKTEQEEW